MAVTVLPDLEPTTPNGLMDGGGNATASAPPHAHHRTPHTPRSFSQVFKSLFGRPTRPRSGSDGPSPAVEVVCEPPSEPAASRAGPSSPTESQYSGTLPVASDVTVESVPARLGGRKGLMSLFGRKRKVDSAPLPSTSSHTTPITAAAPSKPSASLDTDENLLVLPSPADPPRVIAPRIQELPAAKDVRVELSQPLLAPAAEPQENTDPLVATELKSEPQPLELPDSEFVEVSNTSAGLLRYRSAWGVSADLEVSSVHAVLADAVSTAIEPEASAETGEPAAATAPAAAVETGEGAELVFAANGAEEPELDAENGSDGTITPKTPFANADTRRLAPTVPVASAPDILAILEQMEQITESLCSKSEELYLKEQILLGYADFEPDEATTSHPVQSSSASSIKAPENDAMGDSMVLEMVSSNQMNEGELRVPLEALEESTPAEGVVDVKATEADVLEERVLSDSLSELVEQATRPEVTPVQTTEEPEPSESLLVEAAAQPELIVATSDEGASQQTIEVPSATMVPSATISGSVLDATNPLQDGELMDSYAAAVPNTTDQTPPIEPLPHPVGKEVLDADVPILKPFVIEAETPLRHLFSENYLPFGAVMTSFQQPLPVAMGESVGRYLSPHYHFGLSRLAPSDFMSPDGDGEWEKDVECKL
ncbi:hypothetical protein HDU96_009737 [Phlyctochytrium bullatum]|nr:hypothetical protein HDU96_009737 [Phlyctochytrium bullatum]